MSFVERGTIENKKEELRQLVGERYRDLIDAADTIVTMASSAAEVVGSVVKMQKLCNQVYQSRCHVFVMSA